MASPVAAPAAATESARWDGRFQARWSGPPPPGLEIGALGPEAGRFRGPGGPPASVLETLPAARVRGKLAAVPALGYGDGFVNTAVTVVFAPAAPLAAAPFAPAPFR